MTGRHGPGLALAAALGAALLGAATPGRATADDDHDHHRPAPVKKWSRAISFGGGAESVGGISGGGFGVDVEVARGRGRWQLVGDASMSWMSLAVHTAPAGTAAMTATPAADVEGADGFRGRLGVGARWIARSFEPDHSAAIEMFLEGGAGLERIWWNGGGTLTRPDLALGAGWQVRGFEWPRIAIRLSVKALLLAPVDDEAMAGLCRGTCPPAGQRGSDAGFIGHFGVSW